MTVPKSETIESYRLKLVEADEHYLAMLKQHGAASPQAQEALRNANDAHGEWAEWYYNTE